MFIMVLHLKIGILCRLMQLKLLLASITYWFTGYILFSCYFVLHFLHFLTFYLLFSLDDDKARWNMIVYSNVLQVRSKLV